MLPLKPKQLGLFFKPMEYRKRFGMSISAYLHVPFSQSEGGTLWGEQSLVSFLAAEMEMPLIDEGVSKMTSEFLVHGSAYTQPDQRHAVAVRARLGTAEKTVLAFGDRYWDGNSISPPVAFERMPLRWANAYGGPDFPANPQGKGRVTEDGIRWLPNLEHPASRIRAPEQSVVPACYGPIDILHPQRVALRGTYDEAWSKEHAPGYPPDVNWKYFNMAPRDQWLESPLRGDEPYALENLHPERPLIEGVLPGLRVRVFANREIKTAAGIQTKLREVSMRLSTVWFFPHAERMVLIFHGLAECAEDDGTDIKHVLGAVERIGEGQARPDAHYLDVLTRRTQGPEAAFEILNDDDLIPAGIDVADPSEKAMLASFEAGTLKEDALRNRARIDVAIAREDLMARGKDPDALGVVMPAPDPKPKPSEMAQYYKKLRLEKEKQDWAMAEDALGVLEKTIEALATQKLDPAKLTPRGPPKLRGVATLELLQRNAAQQPGKPFDVAAIAPKLQQLDLSDQANYLESAHLQAPVAPLTGDAAATCRREFEWMLARGMRSFLQIDLTGADLSGMDLRGLDFTGAWLESANLSGCNLSRAIFVSAVLAHANLRDTIAIRTNFMGANLGAADLRGTVLDQASLVGTILMRTGMADTDFRGARIAQAQLLESKWANVDWTGAEAPNLSFVQLDLRTVNFAGANLKECVFVECKLDGAVFDQANLETATFVDCKLEGARFVQARMPGAVFTTQSAMKRASFAGALLTGANLGLCDLEGASFVRAVLDGANLANANLAGADLRRASGTGAVLRKANLAGARLAQANLKDALLGGADLRGADLRDTNLFGSDLARAHLDTQVRLEGALLERARIYPRLRPAQPDPAGG